MSLRRLNQLLLNKREHVDLSSLKLIDMTLDINIIKNNYYFHYLFLEEMFFMDCQSTAGMAILVVLNILCSAENFVTTVSYIILFTLVTITESYSTLYNN